MKSVALHNLGCKVNSYEMDVMRQKLQENGYSIVPFDNRADIYIVNTCTVTAIADKKSRQMLHQARKRNPEAIVVAAGCYVETGKADLERDLEVDLLIGNKEKPEIVSVLAEYYSAHPEKKADGSSTTAGSTETSGQPGVDCANADRTQGESQLSGDEVSTTDLEHAGSGESHTRAFMKIQDGCNQFCTYCIIPYARGRITSRDDEDVLEEMKQYVKAGYHEFVLTGIHVSSFGMDRKGLSNVPDGESFDGSALLELFRKADALPGVERLRFGSLEPRIITEDFAQGLAALKSFCPHFHLSLQSGCDATLKRMNRHYTTAQFRESVEILRRVFDNPAITTDVITGFPGETEEEFAQTVEFVKDINFYEMHVFPYSRREGTPAAAMKEQLTNAQKKQRSDVLLEMTAQQAAAYRRAWIGKEVDVLLEEEQMIDGVRYQTGLTREYIRCAVRTDEDLQGQIVRGIVGDALSEDIMTLCR